MRKFVSARNETIVLIFFGVISRESGYETVGWKFSRRNVS